MARHLAESGDTPGRDQAGVLHFRLHVQNIYIYIIYTLYVVEMKACRLVHWICVVTILVNKSRQPLLHTLVTLVNVSGRCQSGFP